MIMKKGEAEMQSFLNEVRILRRKKVYNNYNISAQEDQMESMKTTFTMTLPSTESFIL